MTQLLDQTMNEVYKLPPEKQDIIAIVILDQLQKENKWNDVFVALADKLAQLAQTARSYVKTYTTNEQDSEPVTKLDLANEPFVGMWKDREEMKDSTAWVREVRQTQWRSRA
ncbi:MAG: hypothetical protein AAF639_28190 [Chloroflexota bacterium]